MQKKFIDVCFTLHQTQLILISAVYRQHRRHNSWSFNAKQALGVKSWDIYESVLGSFGNKVDKIISIGGDVADAEVLDKKKANRFKPVVIHLGPYKLEKGLYAPCMELRESLSGQL